MKRIKGENLMKIYLSGPMNGVPEYNYPEFKIMAKILRDLGHEVYNPAEFPYDGYHENFPIRKAFASFCKFICEDADGIYMLGGWEKSDGAKAEHALAKRLGLKITYQKCPLQ
jgi:hypothetical protein